MLHFKQVWFHAKTKSTSVPQRKTKFSRASVLQLLLETQPCAAVRTDNTICSPASVPTATCSDWDTIETKGVWWLGSHSPWGWLCRQWAAVPMCCRARAMQALQRWPPGLRATCPGHSRGHTKRSAENKLKHCKWINSGLPLLNMSWHK